MKTKDLERNSEDLVLEEDTVIEGDLICGDIKGKDGERFNLTVRGNIDALSIDTGDITAGHITALSIDAGDINTRSIDTGDITAGDITARRINAWSIDAENIDIFAFCIAYNSFKCVSVKARRENHVIACLDKPIKYKKQKERGQK